MKTESTTLSKADNNLFQCDRCQYSTDRSGNFNRHIKIHNNEYLNCQHCKSKFICESDLMNHIKQKHNGQPLVCDQCGSSFSSKNGLRAHIITKHDGGKLKYKCHLCPCAFHGKPEYEGHINKHLNSRPYRCAHCGKGFYHRKNQRRHEVECKKISV